MTKPTGRPPGRPRKDLSEEMQGQVRELAVIGLTDPQIARCVGLSESCLQTKYAPLLAEGRADGNRQIAKSVFRTAIEDKNVAMMIFLAKVRLRWSEARPAMPGAVVDVQQGEGEAGQRRIRVEFVGQRPEDAGDATPEGSEQDA